MEPLLLPLFTLSENNGIIAFVQRHPTESRLTTHLANKQAGLFVETFADVKCSISLNSTFFYTRSDRALDRRARVEP